MTCPLCHDPITWQHGWPACRCDARRTLTLTVPQAAEFIGRTRSCTYHLIYDGYLHALRSRRPIQVPVISVKAYLAAEHACTAFAQATRQRWGGQP